MKNTINIFAILLLIVTINSCDFKSNAVSGSKDISGNTNSNKKEAYYFVTRFVDGDTFWVDNGTKKGLKIRLIGVDTPEVRKSKYKDIGYYGKEASEYIKTLIGKQKVRLEFDVERLDKYKRTLAYAYLEDGTFINAELVKNGYARTLSIRPNTKFANEFKQLEKEARKNHRGLWNE